MNHINRETWIARNYVERETCVDCDECGGTGDCPCCGAFDACEECDGTGCYNTTVLIDRDTGKEVSYQEAHAAYDAQVEKTNAMLASWQS